MTGKKRQVRRRAKLPKTKAEAKRPVAGKALRNERVEVSRLQKRLEEALKREAEAHEQQAATSEILRVISSSPNDVQPVFDAIIASALRLCDATFGGVFRFHDGQLHVATLSHVSQEETDAYHRQYPRPPHRNFHMGRAFLDGRPVHVEDVLADPDYDPGMLLGLQRVAKYRTVLAVPILKDGVPIGVVGCARREVKPFTPAQIELVKTFAEQAVIAIENVRLFTELEGRNRDLTATSEILRVISSSPTDVQPVFDAILRSAVQLSGALLGGIYRFDGKLIHLMGVYGTGAEAMPLHARDFPRPLSRGFVAGRAILERRVTQMPDAFEDPEFEGKDFARAAGWRSSFSVPMLRDGQPIGAISVARAEPGLVPETIVALLRTFSDQAVIAVENVRLFKELEARNSDLTEALEQQTATSEVLKVISRSAFDLQPVLDALIENAVRLCGADRGFIYRQDGEVYLVAANYGHSPEWLEVIARHPIRQDRRSATGRAVLERQTVHIHDILADPEYKWAEDLRGEEEMHRTILAVPMVREGAVIGVIVIRRIHVQPFTDKQIEVLRTFADQAVIAIENVRLFTELEGRNRDLTATSEILRVISSSPTDVQPVFDTIVRSAVTLCDGLYSALFQFDGELLHHVAQHNVTAEGIEELRRIFPVRPTRALGTGRAIVERAVVHIPDVESDPEFRHQALSRAIGFRSGLFVPMLREGNPIGVIFVSHAETGPFSDNEIALMKTFADQAVIAIENVRLFKELEASNSELRVALEQQTATSEVLKVISRSTFDLQPVLETLIENAAKLCGANHGNIFKFDGEVFRTGATYTSSPEFREYAWQIELRPGRGSAVGRIGLDPRPVHILDVAADPEYQQVDAQRIGGFRTALGIPMLREGILIGALFIWRTEVRAFTDKQIELVTTFADQAVIAIENVRLFSELEGRNRDLTATSEILRVISSSPTDVQPVFDTIVRSAVSLCDGLFSAVFQFDGELIHQVAEHNYTPEGLAEAHRIYPARPTRTLLTGRAILERAVVHVPDVELDPEFQHKVLSRAVGWRSGLYVPMLREGAPIGVIWVARAAAGPFSDNEIELLKTFADQAVIAVENVRLFKELQARTGELTQSVEKLTALGEVGRAVNSTLDVETVLDTIVSRASQLAGAEGCSIYEYDEATEKFELRAAHNDDTEFVAALRAAHLRKGEGLMGRAAEMREPIQIPDITRPGAYQSSLRDTLIRFGYRSLLAVPLLREEQIIGSLSFNRKAAGAFSQEIVDVLKTFATQSALAIQNARLFREIADKSAQLEAASRHKSEFLANMSHELRTPLNAIIGFSEVLVDRMFGELNEKQDEYLKDIYASGQHLLSLINDILDLAKIEAGRMELEATDFDLPGAIDNALILVRERASRRGITLGHSVDERLGSIRGDERKVKQVLLNLLSNALKFTPEGGRIDVSAEARNGDALVSVKDTGVGIAPEDQEAVFEEFRQVGTADKKVEGTGLGLALSRKFIELHGGKIWVTSTVGAGSTFSFTLPLQR